MKHCLCAGILAAAVLMLCAACSLFNKDDPQTTTSSETSSVTIDPGPPPDFPVTVRDTHIGARPERIISLSPMLTEMLFDIGAIERVVAVSDYCDYPLDVESLPKVGSAMTLIVDDLITLAPDLIVTLVPLQTIVAQQLEAAGIPVLVLGQAADVDELTALYGELGRAVYGVNDTSGESKGQELYTSLEKIGGTVQAYLSSINKSPYKALYITTNEPNFATGDTFEASMLALIGVGVATGDATGYELNEDEVKATNADIIIDSAGLGLDVIKGSDRYKTLPAVSQGKLYEIDGRAVECRGMRLPVLLKALAEEIYPAAFG